MALDAIAGGSFDLSALRDQFQHMRTERFRQGDTNQSGGLSLEEFKGLRANSPFGSAESVQTPKLKPWRSFHDQPPTK